MATCVLRSRGMCVIRYFRTSRAQLDAARCGMRAQRLLLFGVGEAVQLVDEAPRQPRADVLAQRQLRRRRARTGEQHRARATRAPRSAARTAAAAVRRRSGRHRRRDRAVRPGRSSIARLRVDPAARRAGGDRAQQVTATAALRAPEQHEALAAAIDERAQRGNRFGVSADDEVVERGAQRLDEVEGQLARAVVHRWRSRRSAARLTIAPRSPVRGERQVYRADSGPPVHEPNRLQAGGRRLRQHRPAEGAGAAGGCGHGRTSGTPRPCRGRGFARRVGLRGRLRRLLSRVDHRMPRHQGAGRRCDARDHGPDFLRPDRAGHAGDGDQRHHHGRRDAGLRARVLGDRRQRLVCRRRARARPRRGLARGLRPLRRGVGRRRDAGAGRRGRSPVASTWRPPASAWCGRSRG